MKLLTYRQALRYAASFSPRINTAQIALDIETGRIPTVFVPRRTYREEDIEAACKSQADQKEAK